MSDRNWAGGGNTFTTKRLWRIEVNSDDGAKIRYEEPFQGTEYEARVRAKLMWARASYVVNGRTNRDTYVKLEVQLPDGMRTVWEHRGKLPDDAPAPSGS